jgi:hypothetical protein
MHSFTGTEWSRVLNETQPPQDGAAESLNIFKWPPPRSTEVKCRRGKKMGGPQVCHPTARRAHFLAFIAFMAFIAFIAFIAGAAAGAAAAFFIAFMAFIAFIAFMAFIAAAIAES